MPVLRPLALAAGLLAALAIPAVAAAADNAFLIQGPVQVEGAVQMANNCLANKGMAPARFRQLSEELKREYLKDVTPAAARKVSFRFAASCPGGYKGSCEGIFGEKASQHYMADDYMIRSGMAKLL
jgi:hypothetical protein